MEEGIPLKKILHTSMICVKIFVYKYDPTDSRDFFIDFCIKNFEFLHR